MTTERDIDLINDLRAKPAELSWIEFKHNNDDPEMIGKLCSALSNSARIDGQECAYVVWGIENETHRVVGTTFEPDTKKVGGQVFQMWLVGRLQPKPAFQFRTVNHPDGRVVLLEIPAPTQAPIAFDGIPYVRIGSGTPKLTDHPERYQQIIERMRPYSWEHGMAARYVSADYVLSSLDYIAYFSLIGIPAPDNRQSILERLKADQLIERDVGEKWNVTNLGAILFATELERFGPSIARKGVRLVAYDGVDRTAKVTHRHDGRRGYASGFQGLISYINGLLPQNEHIGQALRESRPLFPTLAIRELIANALIHQDMTITGMGPQIEIFKDRIEITNPGKPLLLTDRMIDLPPRSRNEAVASLMRRMGICEEQGSGLDKVLRQVEVYQLPPPLLRADDQSMQVILYGPRTFAEMTAEERTRACYFHAVLRYLSGERMKNATLCERFGIDPRNAAQASGVIKRALQANYIKVADPDHPRAGYLPGWA